MRLYKDVFSKEEILTDSFAITFAFNNCVGKIQSRYIVVGGDNIDVGAGGAFGGKGSDDEGVEDQRVKVLDVLDIFKYNEVSFDKKSFQNYFRTYIKKLKTYLEENNKDRVADFMAGATEAYKHINANFD